MSEIANDLRKTNWSWIPLHCSSYSDFVYVCLFIPSLCFGKKTYIYRCLVLGYLSHDTTFVYSVKVIWERMLPAIVQFWKKTRPEMCYSVWSTQFPCVFCVTVSYKCRLLCCRSICKSRWLHNLLQETLNIKFNQNQFSGF